MSLEFHRVADEIKIRTCDIRLTTLVFHVILLRSSILKTVISYPSFLHFIAFSSFPPSLTCLSFSRYLSRHEKRVLMNWKRGKRKRSPLFSGRYRIYRQEGQCATLFYHCKIFREETAVTAFGWYQFVVRFIERHLMATRHHHTQKHLHQLRSFSCCCFCDSECSSSPPPSQESLRAASLFILCILLLSTLQARLCVYIAKRTSHVTTNDTASTMTEQSVPRDKVTCP